MPLPLTIPIPYLDFGLYAMCVRKLTYISPFAVFKVLGCSAQVISLVGPTTIIIDSAGKITWTNVHRKTITAKIRSGRRRQNARSLVIAAKMHSFFVLQGSLPIPLSAPYFIPLLFGLNFLVSVFIVYHYLAIFIQPLRVENYFFCDDSFLLSSSS